MHPIIAPKTYFVNISKYYFLEYREKLAGYKFDDQMIVKLSVFLKNLCLFIETETVWYSMGIRIVTGWVKTEVLDDFISAPDGISTFLPVWTSATA